MRKTSFRRILNTFEIRLTFYADLADRVFKARRMIRYKQEKYELLEAFVLRLVTLWDVFVEELLVGSLNRDGSKYAAHTGLRVRKHLSFDECYALLTGLGYLDIRSVGEAQRIGNQILVESPFNVIQEEPRAR